MSDSRNRGCGSLRRVAGMGFAGGGRHGRGACCLLFCRRTVCCRALHGHTVHYHIVRGSPRFCPGGSGHVDGSGWSHRILSRGAIRVDGLFWRGIASGDGVAGGGGRVGGRGAAAAQGAGTTIRALGVTRNAWRSRSVGPIGPFRASRASGRAVRMLAHIAGLHQPSPAPADPAQQRERQPQ